MKKPIDYSVQAGKPLVVEIEKDGKTYQIKVVVAIMGIDDLENVGDDGIPQFGVHANLATQVVEKP